MNEPMTGLAREHALALAAGHDELAGELERAAANPGSDDWGLFGRERQEAEAEEDEARAEALREEAASQSATARDLVAASGQYEATDDAQARELANGFDW